MTDGMTRFDGGFMCALLRSAAGGGPEFRLGRGFSLSGVQIASRASACASGIRLHLGGDAVERLAQAQVVAQRLEAAALAQRRERLVGVVAERLGLLADELLDLVVGDLEPELVGDGLEHELARDRALRLVARAARRAPPASGPSWRGRSRAGRRAPRPGGRRRAAARACAPRRAARRPRPSTPRRARRRRRRGSATRSRPRSARAGATRCRRAARRASRTRSRRARGRRRAAAAPSP